MFCSLLSSLSPFKIAIPKVDLEPSQFEKLPDELILHIFSYLPPFELAFARLTCKKFVQIIEDKQLLSCWGKFVWKGYVTDTTWQESPANTKKLLKILVEPCPFTKGKLVCETHFLFRYDSDMSFDGSYYNDLPRFNYLLIPFHQTVQSEAPPVHYQMLNFRGASVLLQFSSREHSYLSHRFGEIVTFKPPQAFPASAIKCFMGNREITLITKKIDFCTFSANRCERVRPNYGIPLDDDHYLVDLEYWICPPDSVVIEALKNTRYYFMRKIKINPKPQTSAFEFLRDLIFKKRNNSVISL